LEEGRVPAGERPPERATKVSAPGAEGALKEVLKEGRCLCRGGRRKGVLPISSRLIVPWTPKRGFTNIFKTNCSVLNVGRLSEEFPPGSAVTPDSLVEKGLLKNNKRPVKILGDGEINVALTVKANMFSQRAVAKIEAAGGKAEVIEGGV